jgi:hypothetical protein
MELNLEDQLYLQEALTFFEPIERLPTLVPGVREIYLRRHLLRQMPFDERTIAYLAGLVRTALDTSQRFRVFDCLKVLRAIIIKADGHRLSPTTVRDLFAIYRQLILSAREEMQWCLSRLVKDQELDDADVSWLLSHWNESEHLVNRLLLYPVSHTLIDTWTRERYDRAELSHRKSELIARLLEVDDLAAFRNEDPTTLAWAVFRSRRIHESKVSALTTLVSGLDCETIVNFAIRLDAPELIRKALAEVAFA